MRNAELVLAVAALVAIPVLVVWRAWAWYEGIYTAQRSKLALEAAAPEKRPEGDYASSRDCRSCHPEAYRAWQESYHSTMTQLATPEAVVAGFDDVELAGFRAPDEPGGAPRPQRYRLSRRGDEYWVTLLSPAPGVPDREGRIVMTTGSHHHQIVWVWAGSGRELFNLPFTWLIDEQRWIPRTDSFLAPPEEHFGGVIWSDICIECHSTQGRPRIAEGKPAESQVADFGIACESCHGPAGPHIAANQLPWRRYAIRGEADPTIVNPERLSARQASHVCGRCHAILSYPEKDTWQGQWNDVLPGDELESSGRLVIHPESSDPRQRRAIAEHALAEGGNFPRDRFWADGGVRVAGRELNDVVTSPCFAGGEFSCLSCHSMHGYESTVDQLAPEMTGDGACVQCHTRYAGDASDHTRHAPESAGSRCANCHMPYTTYGLLKAIRSHRVTSPSVATELATGRPNACNACHLDRTLAWTQAQLERDYGVAAVALDETAREIAAAPRWVATGDGGVRALAGWYMGWEPARQVSGSEWMAPYLAELMADSYAAVRAVASRSLRTLPGFDDLDYDFVQAEGVVGDTARRQVQDRWAHKSAAQLPRAPGPLLAAGGGFDRESWGHLVESRDHRPIALIE